MATIGLHGRIAIVTGASRGIGIGAAICRALAANGSVRLIAFLASDEAAWITGQVMHSRGGFQ
jgi:NAD(P)-dependent dehydrogenase (short-subunit alcohol dehydrogenase family)